MAGALQYLPTNGQAELLTRLRATQAAVHGPVPAGHLESGAYDLVTCNGSQDGLSKSLEMMAGPGEAAVVEDHTFFAVLNILDPLGTKYIKVETDKEG